MKRSSIKLIITLCMLLPCVATARGFYLRGTVRDIFTNSGVEDSYVVVMRPDSTVVASGMAEVPIVTTHSGNTSHSAKDYTQGAQFQLEIPEDGEYIISVSMLGYEPVRKKVEIINKNKNKPVVIDDIYLIPKAKDLNELTVTGTKLKVYHKGDTIIYDANAFIIDKHNVLEDLVKKLPGVEFRDGKVFANGRFVENIVIGGKDFLKSDPQQIMKMLPAYVVDKLKFYEKSGEQSKTMGKDMHDSDYVMDVTMKRDYHGTWLGNLEAGGGTEKRWEGLGFAMRFDDRQAISIAFDANNIGQGREAHDIATLVDDYSGSFDMKNLQGNIAYSYYPSDKIKIEANAMVRKQDKASGAEEMFIASPEDAANLYRQTVEESDINNWDYKGGASLTLRPKKGIYGKLSYSLKHTDEDEENSSSSMTGNGDPEDTDSLMKDLLLPILPSDFNLTNVTNAYRDNSSSHNKTWIHDASAETHIATGDNLLRISAKFKANDTHRIRYRDYMSRIFAESVEENISNNLFDTQNTSYRGGANVDYDINYADNSSKRGILTPFYRFEWVKEDNDREMYDRLPADGNGTDYEMNSPNSRWITGHTWRHTAGARLKHEFTLGESERWMTVSANMTADYERKHIDCDNVERASASRRNFILLSPEISLRWHPYSGDRKGSKSRLELKAGMRQTAPGISDLADFTDTSDPMNIYKGNPELKKQTSLEASVEMRHYFEKSKSSLYATLRYTNMWDAVSMQSVYDSRTGIQTMSPINADGGREMSLDCGYGLPLTSNQALWLNVSARGSLSRCANLVTYTDAAPDDSYMHLANYYTKAVVRYNSSNQNVGASYTIAYRGNIVTQTSAPGTHLRDLTNSFTLDLKLPWKISAYANCDVISRYGYAMPSLNRTQTLVNAGISKSLLHDNLELRLSAVDIFHQRKNVFYSVNGAGSTERVNTRYVPAYFLFSIFYNWSYTPKKKVVYP